MVKNLLIVKALKSLNKVFDQGQHFFKDNLKGQIVMMTNQNILSLIDHA